MEARSLPAPRGAGDRRDEDRLVRGTLLVATLFGLVTVAPAKPDWWYEAYALLLRLSGGGPLLVDAAGALAATLILASLAARLLPPARWPWPLLALWLPIAAWSLASAAWAANPAISLATWMHEYLLGFVVMVTGYAAGRSRLPTSRIAMTAFLLTFLYVVARSFFVARSLDHSITTTWFCLASPLLLLWLARECDRERRTAVLVTLLFVAVQVLLHREIPQRMYVFSVLAATVAGALAFRVLGLEPANRTLWRTCVALIVACLTVLCFVQFSGRVASIFLPRAAPENAWYLVFVRSERYVIFQYWLAQGLERPWAGAGLHWWNPLALNDPALTPIRFVSWAMKHAHNHFLNLWLQLGLVGLLAQLVLLAALAYRAIGGIREASVASRRLAVTYVAMLIACFGRNLSDDGLHAGALLLFWLLTGAIVGLQSADARRR